MTRRITLLWLICYFLRPSYVITEAGVLNRHQQSTFKATDQWQRVPEGEAIPPGLHVRFNLTSNTVEAKLMDSRRNEDQDTNLAAVPQNNLQQEIGKDKPIYHTYQEIKESLKELNLAVKSEVAVMIELVSKAKKLLNSNTFDEQELLYVLADLNDRVEEIDVGREFAKIGGIEDVVLSSLNKSAYVQSSALLLLGSALQNNQPVQIAAYKAGLLNKLLALVGSEKDSVLARAIFALSALVRRLPVAQKMMVDVGGAGLLLDVFNVHQPRIQEKILALIYDLLVEQEDASLSLEEAGNNAVTDVGREELNQAIDRLTQYHNIRLEQRLVEHGWCSSLVKYLEDIQGERRKIHEDDECPNISQPEHDKVEKGLNAMLALRTACKTEFKNSSALPCVIVRFSEQYEALKRCENQQRRPEPDEEVAHYYASIGERFAKLANIFGQGQTLQCKDEL